MDDLVRAREPVDFTVLAAFLDSLHSYNVDLLQNLQPNEKLCHYTSLEGAIGIVLGFGCPYEVSSSDQAIAGS